MLEALRSRDFRLLWGARMISSLGSWLLVVAVPAYVLQLTGSLLATGLTVAAEYLPLVLLGPLAGVLSDRWDRRRVMIGTDLYRAAAVALLLAVGSADRIWLVYLVLAAESAGSVLFRPAAQAHTPAVVGTGTALSGANSLNAITDGVVRLVGAPAGAVLMLWLGFSVLVWVDLASYLVSAALIGLSAARPAAPSSTVARRRVSAELAEGWGTVRAHRVTRALLPIMVLFFTANAALSALLIPFGVRELGGSRQAGLVVSALGVGFLLGAPAARFLVDRLQLRALLGGSLALTALGYVLLFGAGSLGPALAAAVLIGTTGSLVLLSPQTTVARIVPNRVLGRVSAVFFTGEGLATLAGAVLGPALAGLGGFRLAMTVSAAATLLSAAACPLTLPRLAPAAAERPGGPDGGPLPGPAPPGGP